ncbi:MAG: hypothetical protein USCGTAYLOR_00490 [Chromatiales bacterium USCg_Taylor]|nr:MAG: hypothetical protein USCGTAYLOR_00490 [Chromatiales bacterium USCg_Taylor]
MSNPRRREKEWPPAPGRPFDVPKSVLDISRAHAELGWRPRVSLNEGLRRTFDWLVAGQRARR